MRGRNRLAIKTKRLLGHVRHALQLFVGKVQILQHASRSGGIARREIDEISHGLERIVDLVRHSSGETPRHRQLLRSSESSFALFAQRYIEQEDGNTACRGIRVHFQPFGKLWIEILKNALAASRDGFAKLRGKLVAVRVRENIPNLSS